MVLVMIAAIGIGLLQAFIKISNTRIGIEPGVPPSNSLIDFTFLNK